MRENTDEIFLYTHDAFPDHIQVYESFPMVQTVGKVRLTGNENRIEVDEIVNDFKRHARECTGINAIVGVKMSICTIRQDTEDYLILSCIGNPAVIGARIEDSDFLN